MTVLVLNKYLILVMSSWWVDDQFDKIRPFPFDLLSFAPIGYDPRYIVPEPLCSCRGPSLKDRYLVSELLRQQPGIYHEWINHASSRTIRTKKTMNCRCQIDYKEITKHIQSIFFSDKDLLYSLLTVHTGRAISLLPMVHRR